MSGIISKSGIIEACSTSSTSTFDPFTLYDVEFGGQIAVDLISSGPPVNVTFVDALSGDIGLMRTLSASGGIDVVISDAISTTGRPHPYRIALDSSDISPQISFAGIGPITAVKGGVIETFGGRLGAEGWLVESLEARVSELTVTNCPRLKTLKMVNVTTAASFLGLTNLQALEKLTVDLAPGGELLYSINIIDCPFLTEHIPNSAISPTYGTYIRYQNTGLTTLTAPSNFSELVLTNNSQLTSLDLSLVTYCWVGMTWEGVAFNVDDAINSITDVNAFANTYINTTGVFTSASATKRAALEAVGVIFAEI